MISFSELTFVLAFMSDRCVHGSTMNTTLIIDSSGLSCHVMEIRLKRANVGISGGGEYFRRIACKTKKAAMVQWRTFSTHYSVFLKHA